MTASHSVRAALFGHPVGHSRSPQMFEAFATAGGPNIVIEPVDVGPNDLGEHFDAFRRGRWDAALVTIPHKQAAATRVDIVHDLAARAGSVNCIARRVGDGAHLVGTNTDGPGFIAGLGRFNREAMAVDIHPDGPGFRAQGRAVVLGAGGAARGVCAALAARGAQVTVVSRSPEKRIRDIPPWIPSLAQRLIAWHQDDLPEVIAGADLVIQATPMGMTPNVQALPPLPRPALDAIGPRHLVVDLIYTPWETPFLAATRARGAASLNGWPMLIHQAAAAIDHWLGAGVGGDLPMATESIEARSPELGAVAAQ